MPKKRDRECRHTKNGSKMVDTWNMRKHLKEHFKYSMQSQSPSSLDSFQNDITLQMVKFL